MKIPKTKLRVGLKDVSKPEFARALTRQLIEQVIRLRVREVTTGDLSSIAPKK